MNAGLFGAVAPMVGVVQQLFVNWSHRAKYLPAIGRVAIPNSRPPSCVRDCNADDTDHPAAGQRLT
jgi:hypothetical protein